MNRTWSLMQGVCRSQVSQPSLDPKDISRAWLTMTACMVNGSCSSTRVPVLVVMALQLAVVSYEKGVSKPIVNFSHSRR